MTRTELEASGTLDGDGSESLGDEEEEDSEGQLESELEGEDDSGRPARRKGLEARRRLQRLIASEKKLAEREEQALRSMGRGSAGGVGGAFDEDRPPEKKKVGRPITYKGDPNSAHLTEEERRRIKRRIANRESARRVRQKRQNLLDELQQKIGELQRQNGNLTRHVREVESSRMMLANQMQSLKDKWSSATAENLRLQGELVALRKTIEVVTGGKLQQPTPVLATPAMLSMDQLLQQNNRSLFVGYGTGLSHSLGAFPQLNTGLGVSRALQPPQLSASGLNPLQSLPSFLGSIPDLNLSAFQQRQQQPSTPQPHLRSLGSGLPRLSSPSLPTTPSRIPSGPQTQQQQQQQQPGQAPQAEPASSATAAGLGSAGLAPAMSFPSVPLPGEQPTSLGLLAAGAPIVIVKSSGQSAGPEQQLQQQQQHMQPHSDTRAVDLFVRNPAPQQGGGPATLPVLERPGPDAATLPPPTPLETLNNAAAGAGFLAPSPFAQQYQPQEQQGVEGQATAQWPGSAAAGGPPPSGFWTWLGQQLNQAPSSSLPAPASLERSPGSAFSPPTTSLAWKSEDPQ